MVTILTLGSIVLGIGCISWAMFSIWSPQSHYIADSELSNNSRTITTTAELNPHPDETYMQGNAFENEQMEYDKILYPTYPVEGDNIGSLTIPALKRELPILQGTNAKDLKKGVGHFIQSVLPGEEDNCVLSGHRDTVFRQLDKLKIGDQLIVKTSAGTFTYEVEETKIVHADNKTVIVPTDHATLTMTTCYPFYAIGDAPDRYIVSAELIKSNKLVN